MDVIPTGDDVQNNFRILCRYSVIIRVINHFLKQCFCVFMYSTLG